MQQPINIFWFRRDLRLEDNHGFYEALKGEIKVLPIFIFDSEILDHLPKNDARVSFIFETLQTLNTKLKNENSSVIAMFHGKPIDIFKQLIKDYKVVSVYTNHDYEPYARERDTQIESFLGNHNIDLKTYKDQVIFEKDDVVKSDGAVKNDAQLSRELGISPPTISAMRKDRLSVGPALILRIHDVYSMPIKKIRALLAA